MEIMKDAKLSDLGEMLLADMKETPKPKDERSRTKKFEDAIPQYARLQGSWLYAIEG